jgi:hypothetical protein
MIVVIVEDGVIVVLSLPPILTSLPLRLILILGVALVASLLLVLEVQVHLAKLGKKEQHETKKHRISSHTCSKKTKPKPKPNQSQNQNQSQPTFDVRAGGESVRDNGPDGKGEEKVSMMLRTLAFQSSKAFVGRGGLNPLLAQ